MSPCLGIGLGLRAPYFERFATGSAPVDWVEIISENYFALGSKGISPHKINQLEKVRRNYPVVMHGVSLSIGSVDKLNRQYLKTLKSLIKAVEPAWVSDHLCWTGVDGINTHELLPLPYTEEALHHVVARLKHVQNELGQSILMENVSSYLSFKHSTLTEWEFLTAVAQESGCKILLDINNVFVSGTNHGFDPITYINAIPKAAVGQIHLAGHTELQTPNGRFLVDTHDEPVREEVWALYEYANKRFGGVSTLIERDDRFPAFEELLQEVSRAKQIQRTKAQRTPASVSRRTEIFAST